MTAKQAVAPNRTKETRCTFLTDNNFYAETAARLSARPFWRVAVRDHFGYVINTEPREFSLAAPCFFGLRQTSIRRKYHRFPLRKKRRGCFILPLPSRNCVVFTTRNQRMNGFRTISVRTKDFFIVGTRHPARPPRTCAAVFQQSCLEKTAAELFCLCLTIQQ